MATLLQLLGQLFVVIIYQFNSPAHFIAQLLICGNILDRVVQYCELFLQELYAMLSYLLLNVTVENRIAKYFVLRHLLAELIAEFLSHLL